ncbi:MAG: carboxypeptidase regulatory-like domain-containing protein [Gemmatimonadota bacterium]|nr:carboxypeptidase regulatory-like domain-containing protein [Gemmatimonadota bacterium]MDE2864720.1 carboxypeptidase regulatory-like domain-containing protein [Gemmatimonadota bacterium]MXV94854.1 TonB-dependent receptor plug domain-containing protein [Gemmatimonadota bacterium]MYB08296.1 TonB-dependent receptor plug domain-containing protein [Gemmatimonadota bacterium]MYE17561.1 TonB-dependent receptor plug domain-containing protein [Gemmatimonadota bacterium]
MSYRLLFSWFAILAAILPAAEARAQAGAAATFAGQVIDTYWGEPVEGAVVRLTETLRPDGSRIVGITGADGRFRIAGVPPGPSQVSVTRIGYADLYQVLDIRDGQFTEVVLIPKPVVLEGLEVYVDRLETRLRELPYVTNTWSEPELKSAPDLNVAEYLHSQPAFEFVPCFEDNSGTSIFGQRLNCIRTRGTMAQRPRIYIDDAPAFGGVEELASLPTTAIYRVEVIRGCGQIRVYTNTYVEGTAVRQRPLLPIVC